MKTVALVLLAAASAFPFVGRAANSNQQAVRAASNPQQISDQDIKTFAAIRAQLNKLRTTYMAKLKATDNVPDRQRVHRESRQAMTAVIRRHGMTVNQYRHMAKTIMETPALRQKLEAMEPGE